MNLLNRSQTMTPTRRVLTVAGVATLALSLLLSIAPAFAANDGTVKLFDSRTNGELGNDPHVCSFYAVFYSNSPESGSWWLVDWDGARGVVEEGTYLIADGSARTPTMSPDAGHYRFEWQTIGSRNTKNKTFWVDSSCAASPAATPTPTPTPSEVTVPSEDPTPTPTPSEVTVPSEDPTPTPTQSEVVAPSEDPTPTPTPTPSEVVVPSSTPEQAVEGSQSTPAPTQVEQDVVTSQGAGSTTLPDTAVPVSESGVLATIGLLLIIAAHAGTRRKRQLPVA